MITLFFVMLAIAAISIYEINKMRIISEEKLNQIKKIQAIVQKLNEPENGTKEGPFKFNPKTGRFEIRREVNFPSNGDEIPFTDREWLEKIGKKLEAIVGDIQKEQESSPLFNQGKRGERNASYLIVIEGTASEEGACKSNYELSYRRAYALWDLWLNAGIKLKVPGVSDVQISGSGSQRPERETVPCSVEEKEKREGTRKVDIDPSSRKFKIQLVPLIPDVNASGGSKKL